MEPFERLEREVVYKGTLVDFCKDTLKLPNGHIVKWDFLSHKGAAAVVAVRDDQKILLVRQYRPSLDRFTLEIPAGGINPGETIEMAASRELEEETGYRCNQIAYMYDLQTTVAFTNEKIGVCLATGLTEIGQQLDEDEFVEIEAYTIDEIKQMILQGMIQDGKTISSILFYEMMNNQN